MKLLLENHGKFNSSLCGNNHGVQEQHIQRLVSDIQIVINELAGAMAPTVTRRENCSKSAATIDDNHHVCIHMYLHLCLSVYLFCAISCRNENVQVVKVFPTPPENGTICRAICVLGKCQLLGSFH